MLLRALDVTVPAQRTGGSGRGQAPPRPAPAPTPAAAFDALYVYAAPGLVQQARLLTGSRRLAFEAVEHAFRGAWERWPEVARDSDPVGWVRAAAHTYALSPWHRLRRFPGRTCSARMPQDDPLLRSLLRLPPRQRRAVLLCDGLGLSTGEAAAETEAGTAATTGRLRSARAALDAPSGSLASRLAREPACTLAQPWSVRESTERRAVLMTRTVWAVVAAFALLVTAVVLTSPS
ncbi:RNA polymerase subunit sigma-70 [Streptomyces sp. SID5785]|nr:RNA polymerase subunit sigma-70 [Streptomyces sp. SID5785]